MKKIFLMLALLVQTALASAAVDPTLLANATTNNVKVYRQAGTSTEVVKSLKTTDEVAIIRKHNAQWTIVTVNDAVGYVLTSELTQYRSLRNIAMAKPKKLN